MDKIHGQAATSEAAQALYRTACPAGQGLRLPCARRYRGNGRYCGGALVLKQVTAEMPRERDLLNQRCRKINAVNAGRLAGAK